MGAVLTQRPELFRAVVIQVPLLDMLRYHRFLIARLWIPEYGSAEDPEQFRWLRAYSPYHHVREGRLSGGAPRHGGERHPGRSDARAQDGGAASGGHRVATPDAAAPRVSCRPRRRQAAVEGAGRADATRWTFVFSELGVEFED